MEHSVLLFCRLLLVLTGASACPRVGSDNSQTHEIFHESDDSDSDFRDEMGLFLNLGSPSQCQGIVTAWHLQYELKGCGSDRVKTRRSRETQRGAFNGVFAVYRPVNNLTMQQRQHEVVPGSTKMVTISCQDDDDSDDRDESRTRSTDTRDRDESRARSTDTSDRDESRTRSTDTRDQEETILLEEEERFMIQRGDIIAICLPRSIKGRDIRRLHILEDIRIEAETPSVHEYDGQKFAVDNCNFDRLQTIRSRLLVERSSYRLHLYAEVAGPGSVLATTTSNSVGTSTSSESLPLDFNDTQELSDSRAEYLVLVAAPTASVGGLLVLAATVLLVAGIVVCWSRRYKQRKSISSTTTNRTELRDTSTDMRPPSTQSRSRVHAPATTTVNVFNIKENVAYQAYNFDEHVYAQPHAHQWRNEHQNNYEISTQYYNTDT